MYSRIITALNDVPATVIPGGWCAAANKDRTHIRIVLERVEDARALHVRDGTVDERLLQQQRIL